MLLQSQYNVAVMRRKPYEMQQSTNNANESVTSQTTYEADFIELENAVI